MMKENKKNQSLKMEKNQNLKMDREDDDNGDEESKTKTSASSSNSIVEEISDKAASSIGVRRYIRSKIPRLRWTPDLHLRFLQAVERLGGHERATPKLILQLMNIKGLSIAHVKSHLQMYRSKKLDDQGQVINSRRIIIGSADHLSYNLWQQFMLPSIDHHKHGSNLRYENVSRDTGHGEWMVRPYFTDDINIKTTSNGIYRAMAKRINRERMQEYYGDKSQLMFANQFCQKDSITLNTKCSYNREETHKAKRKASEYSKLDLNLSLSKSFDEDDIKNSLWLSLGSTSTRESNSLNLNLPSSKYPKLASTLDLTL